MKIEEGWYMPTYEQHFEKEIRKSGGEYQWWVREESFKYVTKWRTAIDVGACIGLWTRDMVEKFDYVHAFEPFGDSGDCLILNLHNKENYQLHRNGLGDKEGIGRLYTSPNNIGTHFLTKLEPFESNMYEDIQLKTLDSYNFKDVDYIKIDVQTYELKVLEGAVETLKSNSPLLCVECARRTHEEKNYVSNIVKFLDNLGYKQVGEYKKEIFFKK